jgi:hypothetical protein
VLVVLVVLPQAAQTLESEMTFLYKKFFTPCPRANPLFSFMFDRNVKRKVNLDRNVKGHL